MAQQGGGGLLGGVFGGIFRIFKWAFSLKVWYHTVMFIIVFVLLIQPAIDAWEAKDGSIFIEQAMGRVVGFDERIGTNTEILLTDTQPGLWHKFKLWTALLSSIYIFVYFFIIFAKLMISPTNASHWFNMQPLLMAVVLIAFFEMAYYLYIGGKIWPFQGLAIFIANIPALLDLAEPVLSKIPKKGVLESTNISSNISTNLTNATV